MSRNEINRREFISHTMKLLAITAGLSITDLEELFATDGKGLIPKMQYNEIKQYSIMQKSASDEIKALKVIIENKREIFVNEFGRESRILQKPLKKAIPKNWIDRGNFDRGALNNVAFVCSSNFGEFGSGMIENLICQGTNTCPGQDLDGGGCAGTNVCSNQSCSPFNCSGNDCSGQKCGDFDLCEKRNNQSIIDNATFKKYRTDPYVQDLMKRFNVNTSEDLAIKLRDMLSERRKSIYHIQTPTHQIKPPAKPIQPPARQPAKPIQPPTQNIPPR